MDLIDTQGTRGTASTVGILASQMQDLARDISEWKTATQAWQQRHEKQHVDEARTRIIGRRWVITTCIAALGMLAVVLTMLFQLSGRIR